MENLRGASETKREDVSGGGLNRNKQQQEEAMAFLAPNTEATNFCEVRHCYLCTLPDPKLLKNKSCLIRLCFQCIEQRW